eukprot:g29354.t1
MVSTAAKALVGSFWRQLKILATETRQRQRFSKHNCYVLLNVWKEDEGDWALSAAQVPFFDGKVVAKVTRVSWESKTGATAQTSAGFNGGYTPQAAAQVTAQVPSAELFDSPGLGPSTAPGPKDDFDMLFS